LKILFNISLATPTTVFLILFCVPATTLIAQTISVQDPDGIEIGLLENDRILSAASKEVLLTIKGNLIFKGDSELKEDIILLNKVKDVYGKSIDQVLYAVKQNVLFTVSQGRFFYGDNPYKEGYLMIYIERIRDGEVVVFEGLHQRRIGFVKGDEPTAAQWVGIAYLFMLRHALDEEMAKKQPAGEFQPAPANLGAGTIRLLFDGGGREYEWDGKVLRRRWMPNDIEDWIFDGESLYRRWNSDREELIWDGKTLQRKWFDSPDVYVWNGRTMRWAFGNMQDEYILQGNIVKRVLSNGRDQIWEINGDLPVPVIMMVVFGLTMR